MCVQTLSETCTCGIEIDLRNTKYVCWNVVSLFQWGKDLSYNSACTLFLAAKSASFLATHPQSSHRLAKEALCFTAALMYCRRETQQGLSLTKMLHVWKAPCGLALLRWCVCLLVFLCVYKCVCYRYTDVLDMVQAVICHPDPRVQSSVCVGAVTACVNPLTSFMEHRSLLLSPKGSLSLHLSAELQPSHSHTHHTTIEENLQIPAPPFPPD